MENVEICAKGGSIQKASLKRLKGRFHYHTNSRSKEFSKNESFGWEVFFSLFMILANPITGFHNNVLSLVKSVIVFSKYFLGTNDPRWG